MMKLLSRPKGVLWIASPLYCVESSLLVHTQPWRKGNSHMMVLMDLINVACVVCNVSLLTHHSTSKQVIALVLGKKELLPASHFSAPSRKVILSVCCKQLGLDVIFVNNPLMCRKWLYWFNMDLEHHPHHMVPSLIWLINYIPCDLSMPSDAVLGACNLMT